MGAVLAAGMVVFAKKLPDVACSVEVYRKGAMTETADDRDWRNYEDLSRSERRAVECPPGGDSILR